MEPVLTKSESVAFLRDVLQLPVTEEVETSDRKPDLEFLNKITKAFMEHIPFQSVTLIAEDLVNRKFPTFRQIKEAMFKRQGGVCHSLNGFMFYLLKSLGFDVILAYATVRFRPNPPPDNHVIIFVNNVIFPDDTYLVDVGFGHPSFEAVSLDFDKESPVYKHSFLEYKFFKQNGKIIRAHGKGDSRFGKPLETWQNVIGSWIGAYEFTTDNIRPFEEFKDFYRETYRNAALMSFHTSLRATCFPNGRAVSILHNKLFEEEDETLTKAAILDSPRAILDCYLKQFPQFDEDTLTKAVRNWQDGSQ